jgi:predicted ester cyclase
MSEEKHKQIAKRWFGELWSDGRLNVADQLVDPNYDPDWIHIEKVGPEQVKHEVRYFRSVFPDLKYEIVDSATKADCIWVRYKGSGTQEGEAWGFEATGKLVEFEGATILYISSEGTIIDRWCAFCFYDILTDLEHVPPLWELRNVLGGIPEDSEG